MGSLQRALRVLLSGAALAWSVGCVAVAAPARERSGGDARSAIARPGFTASAAGTSTVTVPATTTPYSPLSTAITLAAGQSVSISCSGTIQLSPSQSAGCDGDPPDPAFPTYTGGNGGALIARVGSGSFTTVGTGPVTLTGPGVLQLAINDGVSGCNGSCWSDNTGSFSVTIATSAPPSSSGNTAGVASVQGQVTVTHADGSVEVVTSTTVFSKGDQLATGVGSNVALTFQDGSRMAIGEMTQLYIADLLVQGSRQNVSVALKLGEMSAQVNPKKAYQTDFKVSTPPGTISVRGTVFTVFYDPGARATIVRALVHKVLFTPTRRGARAVIVTAGKEIEATRSRVSKLAPIGKADARGGIDIQKARDLALALVDRFARACSLRSTHRSATVRHAGRAAWTVTIPVHGKATGTSTWKVAAGRVIPINALALQIAAGCR
jgi:hypothetical protein